MKKSLLLPFLLVFLLTACQMHHGLRLDEEEIKSTSLEKLLTGQGLKEEKVKEYMGLYVLSKESLLVYAAKKGWLSVVHKLLLQGVPVDSTDGFGTTPLYYAAQRGHTEIVKLLLEKGVALNSKDDDGRTPLHMAAAGSYTEIVRLLLEKGARVDSRDKDGTTPLHWAAGNGHTEIARLLLAHGADLTIRAKRGYTALWLAQYAKKTAAAAFLEKSGRKFKNKSKAWRKAYYQALTWEKDKDEKKAHAYAKSYANTFSKAKKNNTEEWSAAYHREFWGKKEEGKSKKKSHAYAKVYADAYVKAKTNDNFKDAEKYAGAGDMYASYYALYIAQGKSHEDADGAAYIAATE